VALAHTSREILSISSTDATMSVRALSVTASVNPPADLGSDSGGEEEFHNAVNKKIAKPRGQAGHPGSGGYSLDVVLRKWGSSLIGDVNKLVKQKADQLLDTNHSYRMQDPSDIEDVCHIVEKTYPIVAKYQSAWPVKDMLKQHLKYTSESARKGDLTKRKGKRRIVEDR